MVTVRRAEGVDAGQIAGIFTPARRSMPGVPDIHTADEDAAFIRDVLLPGHDVRVAECEGRLGGMAAWAQGWLTHLYVHPGQHRRGVGTALLAEAKAQNQAGLQLWVFQSNTPARAFYEAAGFACAELTDGSGNEENHPDARYVWPGREQG